MRFYDLRHTHASLMLDSGVLSIKEIQERLGHASSVMTMDRYWHSRNDDEDRARRSSAVGDAMRPRQSNVTSLIASAPSPGRIALRECSRQEREPRS